MKKTEKMTALWPMSDATLVFLFPFLGIRCGALSFSGNWACTKSAGTIASCSAPAQSRT
jgi:hypothetical protein